MQFSLSFYCKSWNDHFESWIDSMENIAHRHVMFLEVKRQKCWKLLISLELL